MSEMKHVPSRIGLGFQTPRQLVVFDDAWGGPTWQCSYEDAAKATMACAGLSLPDNVEIGAVTKAIDALRTIADYRPGVLIDKHALQALQDVARDALRKLGVGGAT